jgi:hypothetical protein
MGNTKVRTVLHLAWYRIKRHPRSAIISVILAYVLSVLLLYILDLVNPNNKLSYKKILPFSNIHGVKYIFYSGEKRSTYYKIGKAITRDLPFPNSNGAADSIGLFDDRDTLENIETSGGYENLMKVTSQNNSFSLVQDAVIKLQDDQLLKSINIITPLFEERLHIFYRKDLFWGKQNRNLHLSDSSILLSANTDPWILNCFSRSVKNIQIGKVGSCTRIIAGDVMDLIERQIRVNEGKKPFTISYCLMDQSLKSAFNSVHSYNGSVKRKKNIKDSIIDVMFYVGADPTDDIKAILDSKKYGLISVSPSFLSKLNSEFKMNLEVADFQKKYDNDADHASTVGTFTLLIASRDIEHNDVNLMLKKISSATKDIQKSLIHLNPPCTDSCYSGLTTNCKYILPLAEFGFYKYFQDEAKESNIEMIKTIIPFLIGIISFFFPILKSVAALNSVWRSWQINQEIDRILSVNKGEIPDDKVQELDQEIADRYGDGELSEAHFNALEKRISAHSPDQYESTENQTNGHEKKKVKNYSNRKNSGPDYSKYGPEF